MYYALTNSDAKIYSFEPMPNTYQRLEKVVAQFPNISTFQAALADKDGFADFFFSESSLGNSLVERDQSTDHIQVRTVSVESIRTKTNVNKFDLVKFDIEGSEKFLFEYPELKSFSRAYIGEVHLDLMPLSIMEIKSKFSDFNIEFKQLKKDRFILMAVEK